MQDLPRTKSSIVTEDKGETMGLPGRVFIIPFFVGIVCMNVPPRSFFIALLAGGTTYLILKFFFMGKPAHFLDYWKWEFSAVKRYRHKAESMPVRNWSC